MHHTREGSSIDFSTLLTLPPCYRQCRAHVRTHFFFSFLSILIRCVLAFFATVDGVMDCAVKYREATRKKQKTDHSQGADGQNLFTYDQGEHRIQIHSPSRAREKHTHPYAHPDQISWRPSFLPSCLFQSTKTITPKLSLALSLSLSCFTL